MTAASLDHTVKEHFDNKAPAVEAIYKRILEVVKRLGPLREEAKKTSIHLVRKTAFAGIATRKNALILTIKSTSDLPGNRIMKREQASANRWHLEVRLTTPDEVDEELIRWLSSAYELSA